MNRVFVIGAGVAGLACAVRLAASGNRVILCEATDHGGGRCRSLSDPGMDRVIDNGNHLLLSGNTAALSYLDRAARYRGTPRTGDDRVQHPYEVPLDERREARHAEYHTETGEMGRVSRGLGPVARSGRRR